VEGLHQEGADEKLVAALQMDLRNAELSEKDAAMMRLAEAMTSHPQESRSAVQSAKRAGWSDEEVEDAVFFISYFNMRTRIMVAFDQPPDAHHPFRLGAAIPMLRCSEGQR
jgi:alkylhydroperoxidase family enzyme